MHLKRNIWLILFVFVFTTFVSQSPNIISPSYWKSLSGTDLWIGIAIAVALVVASALLMWVAIIKIRNIDNDEQERIQKDNEERDHILVENLKNAFKEALREDREERKSGE